MYISVFISNFKFSFDDLIDFVYSNVIENFNNFF